MELSYGPLLAGTQEFDWYDKGIQLAREHGALMGYLTARYGEAPENLLVQCVGRDESLLLPIPAVDKWHADYDVGGINMRGDDVANPRCSDWPDYIEAKRRGATGIMIFSSPDDNPVRVVVIKEER